MVQEAIPTTDAPDLTVALRFGARVRAARQRQGLTLEALAAAAGSAARRSRISSAGSTARP